MSDFALNPIYPQVVVTGCEDSSIAVWTIPEDGLEEDVTEPGVVYKEHGAKINALEFHPTVGTIFASGSS